MFVWMPQKVAGSACLCQARHNGDGPACNITLNTVGQCVSSAWEMLLSALVQGEGGLEVMESYHKAEQKKQEFGKGHPGGSFLGDRATLHQIKGWATLENQTDPPMWVNNPPP